jgi:hypothetical protein
MHQLGRHWQAVAQGVPHPLRSLRAVVPRLATAPDQPISRRHPLQELARPGFTLRALDNQQDVGVDGGDFLGDGVGPLIRPRAGRAVGGGKRVTSLSACSMFQDVSLKFP